MEEFNEHSITQGLSVTTIGKHVIYYPQLASTNETAREACRSGIPEGTVVIAGEQTQARGRLRRQWSTPPGNIALSVIVYPEPAALLRLIMMASLAVRHAVNMVAGLKADIKWPNDVLIAGKKVCGILVENETVDGKTCAVVGIGLNVGLRPSALGDIADTVTSLEHERGIHVSIPEVVRTLLSEFDRLYTQETPDRVYAAWRDALITLGKPVTVTGKNGSIEGIAEDVDSDGALLVRLPDGSHTRVVAGDVTLRKPASD